MPLDVTGPPAAGCGPPAPAGPSDAGPPVGISAVLFASLLAQQKQPAPLVPAKTTNDDHTTRADAALGRKTPDPDKEKDAEEAAPQSAEVPGPLDPAAINWGMLVALQAPPVATPSAAPMGEAPATGPPTVRQETIRKEVAIRKEVMDTALLSAPDALPAQADPASGGLLPLHPIYLTGPQAQQQTPLNGAPSDAAPGAVPVREASFSDTLASVPMHARPFAVAGPLIDVPKQVLAAPLAPTGVRLKDAPVPHTDVPVPTSPGPGPAAAVLSPDVIQTAALPAVMLPQAVVAEAADIPPPAGVPVTPAPPTGGIVSVASRVRQEPAVKPQAGQTSAPARGVPAARVVAPPVTPPAFFARPTTLAETASPIALQTQVVPANNTGTAGGRPSGVFPEQTVGVTPGAPVKALSADEAAKKPERAPVRSDAPEDTSRHGVLDVQASVPGVGSLDSTGGDSDRADEREQADQGSPVTVPMPMPPTETKAPAAAVAHKPLSGPERAQVVRQMAAGVGTLRPQVVANGHGRMTVHLHPKEWGDLRVTIQLAPSQPADGGKQTAVTAHVVAGSTSVRNALETHRDDLTRALRQNGLHLERLTVAVQAAGTGGQTGGAAGENRDSGQQGREQRSPDQWQAAQPQTGAGSGGLGHGGSSAFNAFSGQGGGAFQNQSGARSPYRGGDGAGPETISTGPVSDRRPGHDAGFDRRV